MATDVRRRSLVRFLGIAGAALAGCGLYWSALADRQEAELVAARHRSELRVTQLNEAAA